MSNGDVNLRINLQTIADTTGVEKTKQELDKLQSQNVSVPISTTGTTGGASGAMLQTHSKVTTQALQSLGDQAQSSASTLDTWSDKLGDFSKTIVQDIGKYVGGAASESISTWDGSWTDQTSTAVIDVASNLEANTKALTNHQSWLGKWGDSAKTLGDEIKGFVFGKQGNAEGMVGSIGKVMSVIGVAKIGWDIGRSIGDKIAEGITGSGQKISSAFKSRMNALHEYSSQLAEKISALRIAKIDQKSIDDLKTAEQAINNIYAARLNQINKAATAAEKELTHKKNLLAIHTKLQKSNLKAQLETGQISEETYRDRITSLDQMMEQNDAQSAIEKERIKLRQTQDQASLAAEKKGEKEIQLKNHPFYDMGSTNDIIHQYTQLGKNHVDLQQAIEEWKNIESQIKAPQKVPAGGKYIFASERKKFVEQKQKEDQEKLKELARQWGVSADDSGLAALEKQRREKETQAVVLREDIEKKAGYKVKGNNYIEKADGLRTILEKKKEEVKGLEQGYQEAEQKHKDAVELAEQAKSDLDKAKELADKETQYRKTDSQNQQAINENQDTKTHETISNQNQIDKLRKKAAEAEKTKQKESEKLLTISEAVSNLLLTLDERLLKVKDNKYQDNLTKYLNKTKTQLSKDARIWSDKDTAGIEKLISQADERQNTASVDWQKGIWQNIAQWLRSALEQKQAQQKINKSDQDISTLNADASKLELLPKSIDQYNKNLTTTTDAIIKWRQDRFGKTDELAQQYGISAELTQQFTDALIASRDASGDRGSLVSAAEAQAIKEQINTIVSSVPVAQQNTVLTAFEQYAQASQSTIGALIKNQADLTNKLKSQTQELTKLRNQVNRIK